VFKKILFVLLASWLSTAAFAQAKQRIEKADAAFEAAIPSDIVLPNLLTVGAVDMAGDEAPFTSYGPTVKAHANGYQVESYLPGGERVAFSGTSMASPQVAAAQASAG
jgi:subtilisin family serine protease